MRAQVWQGLGLLGARASVGAVFALFVNSGAVAQFKNTVPLVVVPTTITDSKGNYLDGLAAEDLILYDNNVAQIAQVETVVSPISVVVVIESAINCAPMVDKLARTGILFSELLAGYGGETAILTFSDDVRIAQDFTSDPDVLSHAVRNIRAQGNGAAALDSVMRAVQMLSSRAPNRRRIIFVIAEKHDRSSKTKVFSVTEALLRQNASVYWVSFSPFLTAFTSRPKTVGERAKEDERGKDPSKDAQPLPPDLVPGSLLSVFTELKRNRSVDVATLLSQYSGARTLNVASRQTLELAIQQIAEEVHQQYTLTFQPQQGTPSQFHTIRVEVKGRPEYRARTRVGYWPIP